MHVADPQIKDIKWLSRHSDLTLYLLHPNLLGVHLNITDSLGLAQFCSLGMIEVYYRRVLLLLTDLHIQAMEYVVNGISRVCFLSMDWPGALWTWNFLYANESLSTTIPFSTFTALGLCFSSVPFTPQPSARNHSNVLSVHLKYVLWSLCVAW